MSHLISIVLINQRTCNIGSTSYELFPYHIVGLSKSMVSLHCTKNNGSWTRRIGKLQDAGLKNR